MSETPCGREAADAAIDDILGSKVVPITAHRRSMEYRNGCGYPVRYEKPGMFQSRRQFCRFVFWTVGMAFVLGLVVSWIVTNLWN